jgi:hypothetical protein
MTIDDLKFPSEIHGEPERFEILTDDLYLPKGIKIKKGEKIGLIHNGFMAVVKWNEHEYGF